MGTTHWSNDEYRARGKRRSATGRDAFEHDYAIRHGELAAGVHPKMNPHQVKFRESRDSATHPESHAVAVLLDVTGSMQTVPRILQAHLPQLMDLLLEQGYLNHPQILIGAIGDATCDSAPLQIGQFESGIEIEEDLGKLFLEGGGGGQMTESYELAMYFLARHTSLDCLEKRGKRGYLFIIGDEVPYPEVKSAEVRRVLGDQIQADIRLEDLLPELRERFDVYFVIPKMTQHWGNSSVSRRWVQLLGQNVLKLEDPSAICELIASTIGLAEGKVDLAGMSASSTKAVNKALAKINLHQNFGQPTASPRSGV